jgi:hypothetical protein
MGIMTISHPPKPLGLLKEACRRSPRDVCPRKKSLPVKYCTPVSIIIKVAESNIVIKIFLKRRSLLIISKTIKNNITFLITLVNSASIDKPISTLKIVDIAQTMTNANKGLLSLLDSKGVLGFIGRLIIFLISQNKIASQQKTCIPAFVNGRQNIKKYKQYSII